jgi:uncharacterized damage-inducible protein DinB
MRQLATLLGLSLVTVTLQAQPAAVKAPGFRDLFLAQLTDVETKVVSLAEAMPAEKYSWSPGEGVRSNKEVYLHIGLANYLFTSFIGAKPPLPMKDLMGMEKAAMDKAAVVKAVKDSFAHARKTVEGLSNADMEKPTKMFGKDSTYQAVLFTMANHMHEHLGQSIAYARTNGIMPPWTKKNSE